MFLYLILLFFFFLPFFFFFFFFNDTATTEIYTLSLHDALPIFSASQRQSRRDTEGFLAAPQKNAARKRSEEHTSELQSRRDLVCRLLLEKKKKKKKRLRQRNKKDII